MHKLKKLSAKVKAGTGGAVVLSSLEKGDKGAFIKKALLCRTGKFDGMYGPVTVTKELLEGIAKKYNAAKQNAQNDNDYAPILTDHVREVDRIKGRVLGTMYVDVWVNPETNEKEWGLYGDLRIDDVEAQEKVGTGQYAHLSISFDEETFEFYEVSFVAIEAAKGSIVLSKGDNTMNLKAKHAALSKRHKALGVTIASNRTARVTALGKLKEGQSKLITEATELSAKITAVQLKMKQGQVKAQFSQFVDQGKLDPAEFKKMNFAALSAMPEDTFKMFLASYEARPVSTDVMQFGSTGDKTVKASLSKDDMRKAIELQKAGKPGVSLSEETDEEKDKDENLSSEEADETDEKKSQTAMDEEEFQSCMKEVAGLSSQLSTVLEKLKQMGVDIEKLSESEKKDEEAESKDLSADDGEEADDEGEDK